MKTLSKISALVLVSLMFASCQNENITPDSVAYNNAPSSPVLNADGQSRDLHLEKNLTVETYKKPVINNDSLKIVSSNPENKIKE
jgi:PBP1b-binding outer membrane lipoprotein LpoB